MMSIYQSIYKYIYLFIYLSIFLSSHISLNFIKAFKNQKFVFRKLYEKLQTCADKDNEANANKKRIPLKTKGTCTIYS